LTDPLRRLETALDTPPVPGELRGWAATLHKTFDETSAEVLKQIDSVHPDQFHEIEEQNAELLARVKGMREEDVKNRSQCQSLARQFADLEANATRAGADEKQVIDQQRALLDEGLRFVMDVRRQEMAIRTWIEEAFDRDTGMAD
jgi:CRISPR/Cas system CSM-associated protein Csm4 (group 5 of RAMP superfamily)